MTNANEEVHEMNRSGHRLLRIDPERLLRDLDTLRSFGATGTGVVRPAFSEADIEARAWLAERYRACGLETCTDRFGNVFGLDPDHDRAILIGSHSDTQPRGGWLDGALGVIYGLEIARSVREAGLAGSLGVDAVSWNDEEGRFVHFLGSRGYRGLLEEGETEAARDGEGIVLETAIALAGYGELPENPVAQERHAIYLEGHIEQGPVLDRTGDQLAAVTAIAGAKEFVVTFEGEANHAGTAPMAMRRDAVRAMTHFIAELDRAYADAADDHVVWTFGRIEVVPNAPSIVPAMASVSVQFRAPEQGILDHFEDLMRLTIGEVTGTAGVRTHTVRKVLEYTPTPMDARITDVIAAAARTVAPGRNRLMHSGAGHDAQFMVSIPTGMLFIPSIGGVSHSFDEDTARGDIVAGCEALALAVEMLLTNRCMESDL